MDEISGFLDDVRDFGQEVEALKEDIVSSVVEFGRELADEPAAESDASDETSRT